MFAELERRVAEEAPGGHRRDQPRDRRPRPRHLPAHRRGDAARGRGSRPTTAIRPIAAARSSGRRSARFYASRFGVEIDPETEVMPAIGAKECIYNLCFAFLDPGDVALAADPGYPVYTAGPAAGRRRGGADAARARSSASSPTSERSDPRRSARARLLFLNYPNNPTGAVVPEGFFERVVELAREHEVLVVHDNSYSGDHLRRLRGAELPGDARGEGGGGRGLLAVQGLQHDRLALRGGARKRRRDRLLLAPEDERRLGPVRGGPAGRRGGAHRAARANRAR